MTDGRLERARELLRAAGLSTELAVAGARDEILVLRLARHDWEHIRRLTPDLKTLGYTYVTLELFGEEQQ